MQRLSKWPPIPSASTQERRTNFQEKLGKVVEILILKLAKILFFSLPIALSSMYVKNFFGGVSKKVSEELTENIRQEMSLDIADLDWMDDKTRYLS